MTGAISSNTDLTTLKTQLQTTIGKLGSQSGTNSFINSCWSLISEIEQIGSDDKTKQTEGIKGLLKNLLSIAESLASNESSQAKKDVKEGEEGVQNGAKEVTDIKHTGNKKIDAYLDTIYDNTEKIQASLDVLNGLVAENEELKNNQEQVKKAETELQEKQQKIQEQVSAYNNAQTPEDKRKALNEISSLNAGVMELAASVNELVAAINESATCIQQTVTEQNAIVENAQGEIDTATKGAYTEITNTLKNMEKVTVEEVQDASESSITLTSDGTRNIAIGTALQSTAGVTGGATGHQAQDQLEAGYTRISGTGAVLTNLGTALGQAGKDFSEMANCATMVGTAQGTASALIGTYNTSSLRQFENIVGQGSTFTPVADWTDVQAKATEFQEQINSRAPEGDRTANADLKAEVENADKGISFGNIFGNKKDNTPDSKTKNPRIVDSALTTHASDLTAPDFMSLLKKTTN